MNTSKTTVEYFKTTPKAFLPKLTEMRDLVNKLIPDGVESIKYGMPTIELEGKNFIHYAAMKGHLGFYPTPSGVDAFAGELAREGLSFSKGCIRFPYDKPLPTALIAKIIKFRLKETDNSDTSPRKQ